MTSRCTPALLLIATLLLVAGCHVDSAVTPPDTPNSRPPLFTPSASPPGSFGSVAGVVHFTGAPPAVNRPAVPPACAALDNSQPYALHEAHLANVYVYVKTGAQDTLASVGTSPAILDQTACSFLPHVLAVQQGAGVAFRNSDSAEHNVRVTPQDHSNATVDITLRPGAMPDPRAFPAAETMIPVRAPNRPWMKAWINVAPNPFYAVTASDGSYAIHGLPPGRYILAAVHESLGEEDTPITILGGTTTEADFTFPPN